MKQKIFLLLSCFFFTANLSAQPTSALSLQTCIQRAQKFSYRLQADMQRAEAARKVYRYERSQTLPQFSAELSQEQRYLQPYNFHQQMALVHGDWALGSFLLKTEKSAQQVVNMMTAQNEEIKLEVSRRAALLYLAILQKQVQANLLQKRLDLLKAHYEVAEALWQSGTRTRLDVLQTESQTAQLKEQIAGIELERENLLQELGRLIGEKDIQSLQLEEVATEQICSQPAPDFSPESYQKIPALKALNFRIKAQQLRTQAVKAQQLPRLHLAGGYFADGDPTGDGNYWQANIGVNLPLFLWGATKYQKQESQALTNSFSEQKKQVEREYSIRINQTLTKLQKLKQVLKLQENRLQTTQKAFQFAEANYQAGLITNLDYLSAQQQLTETQIAIQKTQLQYVMNLVEFYVTTNQVEKIEAL